MHGLRVGMAVVSVRVGRERIDRMVRVGRNIVVG